MYCVFGSKTYRSRSGFRALSQSVERVVTLLAADCSDSTIFVKLCGAPECSPLRVRGRLGPQRQGRHHILYLRHTQQGASPVMVRGEVSRHYHR